MELHRRLEALEKGLITEPTILFMPDGSTVSINGPGEYLGELLGLALGSENVSPEQSAHLELIRRCTGSREPGGAHLVDLIRCFLLGPVANKGT
jgi:hypothetical protein